MPHPEPSTAPRKVGVEEELMLVDPDTWALTAVSQKAVRAHEQGHDQMALGLARDVAMPEVEQELFLQQIETATAPCTAVSDLDAEIRRGRRAVGQAAREAGAAAVAMPTPILVDPQERLTPKPRYQRIYDEYGELTRQSLVCAMHMHVDVHSDEEAIGVVDRIRPWLPVLLALSANSPYWRGRDTGYASWRTQLWNRWPTNGPAEPFGDPDSYRENARRLMDWGVALDPGMLYYDIRLADAYPTIEIRVADVCTEVEDAVLVAALARALVDRTARAWSDGEPLRPWRTDLLRAASWRASRSGTAGDLVHPVEQRLAPVREVFGALEHYVAPALEAAGDTELVESSFERLLATGNGASRQRSTFEAQGSLESLVKELCARTEDSWSAPVP